MIFFSYDLPNSVFVNENNLVELPKIEMYHKKINGKDFLFLAGDVQPSSERASYVFSELILEYC
jgi:proteasome assembly chaperone (PAC2) family protein